MLRSEPEYRQATHRLTHERNAVDLQPIQQPVEIRDEILPSRLVRLILRVAETAMIDGHASVLFRQRWDLLPPAHVRAAGSVGKDDGRSVAVDFVKQLEGTKGSRSQELLFRTRCLRPRQKHRSAANCRSMQELTTFDAHVTVLHLFPYLCVR